MDPILPQPPPSPTAPVPPPPEDAGSQALSEALRSSFFIVKIIMVGLVVLFLASGFFTVGPQQQAIILRLGKPVGEGAHALLNPGFHWAFPSPIDEIIYVTNTTLHTADSTVGWYMSAEDRAKGAPDPTYMGNSLNPATTSYALTADTNIIHVVGTARYQITDPIHFLFDFADAPFFITNALNNALLYAATQFTVDDILTSNRLGYKELVKQRMTELTDAEQLGISISQVDVDASPPIKLRNKFNEVVGASETRDKLLKQAESYATTTLAAAGGEAATLTNAADANRKRLVSQVQAEAVAFQKQLPDFDRNPELFKNIRQMTVLSDVYSNAEDRIIEPHASELRLQLSRAPLEPSVKNLAPNNP